MRLSWILLAAAVALAATPVSGASDLSLTESVQSGKRFFRSTESNNKHQQDTELDLTGEERGPDVVKPLLKLKVPAKPLLTIEIPKVKASVKAPQLSIYRVAEDMMGPLTPEKLNTVRLFIEKQVKNNQVAKKSSRSSSMKNGPRLCSEKIWASLGDSQDLGGVPSVHCVGSGPVLQHRPAKDWGGVVPPVETPG